VDWLIGVLKEVFERCRRAKPVLGPNGEPTGECRFEPMDVVRTRSS
jgi:hypothetical protein